MDLAQQKPQHEQEDKPQHNAPTGWRYYPQGNKYRSVLSYRSKAKPRSWVGARLARAWRGVKNNPALAGLLGVLLTLIVTTWLAHREEINQQDLASREAKQQQWLEARRAEREFELAQRQAQQESLQTYLGDMGKLILHDTSPLRKTSAGSEVSRLARAKTLTVLLGLDGQSKRILLQFLKEEELINTPSPVVNLSGADLSYVELSSVDADHNQLLMDETYLAGVNLHRAQMRFALLNEADLTLSDLTEADLRFSDLSQAKLGETFLEGADLTGADLTHAVLEKADLTRAILKCAVLQGTHLQGTRLQCTDLTGADLTQANLYKINLTGATLEGANLTQANLAGAKLGCAFQGTADQNCANLFNADLSNADLSNAYLSLANLSLANLSLANLSLANLSGADLSNADLSDAVGLTDEQIAEAESFDGATMPNGQKYEDWIKDREQRGEDK